MESGEGWRDERNEERMEKGRGENEERGWTEEEVLAEKGRKWLEIHLTVESVKGSQTLNQNVPSCK